MFICKVNMLIDFVRNYNYFGVFFITSEISSNSFFVYTAPVGLEGELIKNALVFWVIFFLNLSHLF